MGQSGCQSLVHRPGPRTSHPATLGCRGSSPRPLLGQAQPIPWDAAAGAAGGVHLLMIIAPSGSGVCGSGTSMFPAVGFKPANMSVVPDEYGRVRAVVVRAPASAQVGATNGGVADAPSTFSPFADRDDKFCRYVPSFAWYSLSGNARGLRMIGSSSAHNLRSVGICGVRCSSGQVVEASSEPWRPK
jgi:hypothetical protein